MSRYKTVTVDVAIDVTLREFTDAEIVEEVRDRGLDPYPKKEPKRNDIACATEDVDDWLHELRAAFLAHDHQHFDVLMSRYEGRFRDELIHALAREMA